MGEDDAAVTLAATLTAEGRRVLLVDLDLTGARRFLPSSRRTFRHDVGRGPVERDEWTMFCFPPASRTSIWLPTIFLFRVGGYFLRGAADRACGSAGSWSRSRCGTTTW